MRVGCIIYACHCGSSLVEVFNTTHHTRSSVSSPYSLVTWVQSQSVTRIITQALLPVVQSDLQDTLDVRIKNNLPSYVVLRIMHVKVKKPPELGHIGLLYCLSSQEYISMTLDVTHYFHWQVAMET